MCVFTKYLGLIGSAVLTFTNKQTSQIYEKDSRKYYFFKTFNIHTFISSPQQDITFLYIFRFSAFEKMLRMPF